MGKIVGKLDLNKTPQLVENNSLIFAKNIKLLKDGTISRDDGLRKLNLSCATLLDSLDNTITKYESLAYDAQLKLLGSGLTEESLYIKYIGEIAVGKDVWNNWFDIDEGDTKTVTTWDRPANYKEDFINSLPAEVYNKYPLFSLDAWNYLIGNISGITSYAPEEFKNFDYETYYNYLSSNLDKSNNIIDLRTESSIQTTEGGVKWIEEGYLYYLMAFVHNHYISLPTYLERNTKVTGEKKEILLARVEKYSNLVDDYNAIFDTILEALPDKNTEGDDIIPDKEDFDNKFEIVGIIPYNTSFYLFLHYEDISLIVKYDEYKNTFDVCNCAWHWSGGTIDGTCTINLNSEPLLSIGEYLDDNVAIPLKVINLDKSSITDDESIYTQTPKFPIFNLSLIGKHAAYIPNGTYQFFIRYEIWENHYTPWYSIGKEFFAGTRKEMLTNEGGLSYIDLDYDAVESFIFRLDNKGITDTDRIYNRCQLGFIIAHDDEVYARSWKHFDVPASDCSLTIYFDYQEIDIKEIQIEDLLETSYQIYNVKNITNFKNKQYISNYSETDFNPIFQDYAGQIKIELDTKQLETLKYSTYYNYGITLSNDKQRITEIAGRSINSILQSLLDNQVEWLKDTKKSVFIYDPRTGTYYRSTKTSSLMGVDITITAKDNGSISVTGSGLVVKLTKGQWEYFTNDLGWGENKNKYFTKEFQYVSNAKPGAKYSESTPNCQNFGTSNTKPYTLENILTQFFDPDETGTPHSISIALGDGKLVGTVGNANTFTFTMLYDIKTSSNTKDDEYYGSFKWLTYEATFTFHREAVTIVEDKAKLTNNDLINAVSNVSTLIPLQGYKFYIHYISETGEITNGYFIDEVEVPYYLPQYVIYPKFTNITYPTGYIACFITIHHHKNRVGTIYNYEKLDDDVIADCIDLDTRLISNIYNLPVEGKTLDNSDISTIANYYPSFDSRKIKLFGSSGKVLFEGVNNPIRKASDFVDKGKQENASYIKLHYDNDSEYVGLVRCTPYINTPQYGYEDEDYLDMNLIGYICYIKKLNTNIDKYYSDTNVYKKVVIGNQIDLDPVTVVADWASVIDSIPLYSYIYSNYNLNFLSLSLTVTSKIKANDNEDDDTVKSAVIIPIDSISLSDIYQLKSMYKSYSRKLYYQYTDKNITKFDNTVRSSILEGDEASTSIYKFKAGDYYNVPTNRGIIVNLVAVGEAIVVHTMDSIFKFDGANSLTTAGGEDVSLLESQPFETGIKELFGSEYGYGGIQNKADHIVTNAGYFFYDGDSNKIYGYRGNNQLGEISPPIEKLLNYADVVNIDFASDFYNDRLFINIKFANDKFVTLTYNTKVGSFVSLHDFDYDVAFNTKTKCYFVKNKNIFVVDKNVYQYNELTTKDTLFPYMSSTNGETYAIVDVIFNEYYQDIKVLESIQWGCKEIIDYGTNWSVIRREKGSPTKQEITKPFMAEEENFPYIGENLRIYTDSTSTELIQLKGKRNDFSISTTEAYKYPSYNLGYYSLNYFRNILNNVKDRTIPERKTVKPIQSKFKYDGDESSLIYGKYVVARFVLDRSVNFKLENVLFVTTSYK